MHMAWGPRILHKLREVIEHFSSIVRTMRSLFQILALAILSLPLVVSGAPAPESEPQLVKRASPQGIDVSFLQGPINWNELKSQGVQFAYIQATDGTS